MTGGALRATIAVVAIAAGCVVPIGAVATAQETDTAPAPPAGRSRPRPSTRAAAELHLQMKAEQVARPSTAGGTRTSTRTRRAWSARGHLHAGHASAYVGPGWHVQPGDRLVVDYINALPDMFQAVATSPREPHTDQPAHARLTVARRQQRQRAPEHPAGAVQPLRHRHPGRPGSRALLVPPAHPRPRRRPGLRGLAATSSWVGPTATTASSTASQCGR